MGDRNGSINDFLENKSIFVTGASGFLGKVLIEKLLYDCPKLNKIYILLRTKGTTQAKLRLNELKESQVFDRIREKNRLLLEKIHVIRGDITFENLAISPADLEILKNEVTIIIHSAATIRFDEPLKRAIRINVTATKRVIDLAYQLKRIDSFVHVSTAYCNQVKINIKEQVYKESLTPTKLMQLSDELSEDMLESLTPHLFGDRPSSYHYTKAMAENLVEEHSQKLPIAIVRPSIITASYKDPFPGWVDNYNGPSGYLVTAGKGILRTMLVDGHKICDMIPVDIVANTIIVAAWYVANNHGTLLLVNCTSGQINPITWMEIKQLSHPWLVKYPSLEMFRYPGPIFVSNKLLHKVLVSVQHDLPTYAIDLLFMTLGHQPMLGPIYQKVHRTMAALEFFTTNEWIYRTENFQMLSKVMNPMEKDIYTIDVRQINWPSYMEAYVLGVRQYLLKEDPSTIAKAKFRLDLLYYATQAAKASAAGVSGALCFYLLRRLRASRK